MLHKFFQWRYWKTRPGSNPIYRKIDSRSKDRDLIHYFHDFGDDNSGNTQSSHWLLKGFSKIFFLASFWCLPLGSPTKVITDYLFTIEQNEAFGLPLGKKSVVFLRLL